MSSLHHDQPEVQPRPATPDDRTTAELIAATREALKSLQKAAENPHFDIGRRDVIRRLEAAIAAWEASRDAVAN